MELRQLRCFRAAAEELHFQRAARRVGLSQPALSQQIKRLEAELGVVLLDRSRQHVALTTAGKAFLTRTGDILSACDAAVREAQALGNAQARVLRVGFVGFLNLRVIAHSIAAFRAAHPDHAVEQIEMPSAEVYASLKEGSIDVGFGVLPVTHPTLKFRKVVAGHWCVVAPATHSLSLAQNGFLPIAALKDQPLILFDRSLNPALHDAWIARFEAAGFCPNIVIDAKQVQTALNLVRDGLGVFVAASYILDPIPEDLRMLRLTGFDNTIAIGVAWHEDNKTQLLKAYLNLLRRELKSRDP